MVDRQDRAPLVAVVRRLVDAEAADAGDVVHVDFPVALLSLVANGDIAFVRRGTLRSLVAAQRESVQRDFERYFAHAAVGRHHPVRGLALADVHVAFVSPRMRDECSRQRHGESVVQQQDAPSAAACQSHSAGRQHEIDREQQQQQAEPPRMINDSPCRRRIDPGLDQRGGRHGGRCQRQQDGCRFPAGKKAFDFVTETHASWNRVFCKDTRSRAESESSPRNSDRMGGYGFCRERFTARIFFRLPESLRIGFRSDAQWLRRVRRSGRRPVLFAGFGASDIMAGKKRGTTVPCIPYAVCWSR